ncbi:MAG: hypothetical protein JXA06_01910 [Bacteroidetes bacterium]|nr:hypothetical protein [Bacteroidota bacterium]
MKLSQRFIFVLLAAFSVIAYGQEEDISELPSEEENKLEWSGNLDVKYTLFHMDRNSPQYILQFLKDSPSSSLLSQYRLEPYLNAEYRTADMGLILKTHASYYSDKNSSFDLFEAYGSFNPSFNTTLQAGKRTYSWGKGYAFNPAGFVNPVKDPENPELAQAGLLSANFEYIKSFSSIALQSFSFLAVIIPPSDIAGAQFGEIKNTSIALKSYFLLWDTDIDLIAYYSADKPKRFGFDFARNLQENIEIHGELSCSQDMERCTIIDGAPVVKTADRISYLLGFRFLHSSNTTIIAEYYHNGPGLNKSEFLQYTDFLNTGAGASDTVIRQQISGINQMYFKGSTLMQEYLYVKIIHPEPFYWLYFTPSLYTIYNISDNSFLLSLQMSFKPITNTEFIFWTTLLGGSGTTEYGGKQVQERIELWMRLFF